MNGPGPSEADTETPSPEPTLAQWIEESLDRSGTGLPVSFVVRVVSDVARELDRLHDGGWIHGGVQASQIAVPPRGPARLGEPSLVALSIPGSVGGDVAGLVAAAYYALCGVQPSYFRTLRPRDGASKTPRASSFLVSPVLHRSDLPSGISDVLMKGLSPHIPDRYATAGEFAAALRAAAGRERVLTPPFAVRSRRPLAVAALAAGLALLGGVWLGHLPARQSPPRMAADPAAASKPSPSRRPVSPANENAPPVRPLLASSASPRPRLARTAPPTPAIPPVTPPPEPLPERGYLRVYARQALSLHDALQRRVTTVPALRVLIDGRVSRSLTSGHWASLPPGPHQVAFYPAPGLPFDPNTMFRVRIEPRRRLSCQVPLPRHPGGVQGADAKKLPLSPV